MNLFRKLFLPLLFTLPLFLFTACDPDEPKVTGDMELAITDAPIDDASVDGAFVTVTEVKVDGETFAGFTGKQTIDLMAYQNGDTKLLGMGELEAKSYSRITLVLDYARDANDEAPGCYILKKDGTKEELKDGGEQFGEVDVTGNIVVNEDNTSEYVIDFDLRKTIGRENGDYEFVSNADLASGLRLVDLEKASDIKGNFETSLFTEAERVVVYAYSEGSFNEETETKENDQDIQFQNAVSSSLATKSGNEYTYELAFLEEGDYEICFASYEDSDNDGEYEFKGFLQASIMLDGSVTTPITIDAGLTANLSLSIIGLIK